MMGRKLKKQFEYVDSKGIEYMAIVGEREVKAGKITLRDMKRGTEKSLTFEDALKELA
ncbi:hypothetical protein DRN67_03045 [Candidatus Micrarchaeota archaeon]|nr:MAG: hypothetical protein DRN67_03045 [Candidatus Micrarchaeota archaeon]